MFPNLIIRGNHACTYARRIVSSLLEQPLCPRKETIKSIENFVFWRISCGMEIDAYP